MLICLLKYLREQVLLSASNFEMHQINMMDCWMGRYVLEHI